MVQELKAELLVAALKITNPSSKGGGKSEAIRKNQKLCSLPILSLDGFNEPRPTSKILLALQKCLYYGYAHQISSRRRHWKELSKWNDRILEIVCSKQSEIGDATVSLMIEIMGKHSNIILLDRTSKQNHQAIKHVGFLATGPFSLDRPM